MSLLDPLMVFLIDSMSCLMSDMVTYAFILAGGAKVTRGWLVSLVG